jgi:hypothetical protein
LLGAGFARAGSFGHIWTHGTTFWGRVPARPRRQRPARVFCKRVGGSVNPQMRVLYIYVMTVLIGVVTL